ncbi:S-adenosyl-L-methionine-dependent methyltransferase [Xylaria bambusicola]|uniref:S-adenosyl-L-methionine-dependent methyltransferase n=1 Tax=Xylaria bambusicola TaxID=326684 RepID=UPI0020086B6B|nr:S-adenosyl-L-methionine-dependent methyltransferase [Xylaria bambusicola]KAI0503015.1 S-adenosyl-L-methionine-dependent methyltransferase [Xylaria bambusicola]
MSEDAASINRSIFNEEAASYDDKHRKLNERLTRELQARLDFIGVNWASDDEDSDGEEVKDNDKKPTREVRLLDYACGTGMMSRALLPYTTQCVGMDISEKMVAAYNARAENQGLSPNEMHAVVGDLASEMADETLSSPELFNFDIAVVGGGFHHFGNPGLAAKRLVERLKPGGVLLIWDFLPHAPRQGHHHEHHHGHGKVGEKEKEESHHNIYHSVMHHGFSEPQMREIFTAAGAGTNFKLEHIGGGFTIAGHGHHKEGQSTATSGSWDLDPKDGSGEKGEDIKDKEAFRREVFFARGTKGGE